MRPITAIILLPPGPKRQYCWLRGDPAVVPQVHGRCNKAVALIEPLRREIPPLGHDEGSPGSLLA